MLCYSALRRDAILDLVILLYHQYPKVRKEAAEKLYLALISSDELSKALFKDEKAMEETTELLANTDWSDKLRNIGATREAMHSNFGLPPPTLSMEKLIEKEETKMVPVKKTLDKFA